MSLPFGIDISAYQGKADFDVISVHAEKVEFIGIRAGISWGYTDKWFSRNWAEAKRVGIPRTAYHVLYPAQPIKAQMDHWLTIVGSDLGEMPLTLDVELVHGCSKNQLRDAILSAAGYITAMTGKKPIMYSRASFMDYYVTFDPVWNEYKWWLAQYLATGQEHQGPPMIPRGLDRERVIIHQTADHTPGFGVESKQLDYNRWQGDLASLYAYIGKDVDPSDDTGQLSNAEKVYNILQREVKPLL